MGSVYLIVFVLLRAACGLTMEEHGELARKQKYYYASVRPQERNNRVTSTNGTFFALNSDLKIISTRPHHDKVHMEIIFGVTFTDERLIIRKLKNRFRMPPEFQPWLPDVTTRPDIPVNVAVYLNPLIGTVDAFYQYSVELLCSSEIWQHPFKLFKCEIAILNVGDERIFLRNIQDLRSAEEMSEVSVDIETIEEIKIIAKYSELWFSSMAANILPSMVIFSVVIFAQYRRRKVHMLVTISALVSIIFMQSARRIENTLTLEDLWLSVTFLHIVCVLLVDLAIPTYRIQYIDTSNDVDIMKRLPLTKRFTVSDGALARNCQTEQQITIATSGRRKQLSLAIITCCYFIFVVFYFTFALHLILDRRNFL